MTTIFPPWSCPLIIKEIVDDLQPLLTAYQAAFYWYLFRHSIAKNGNPLLRTSTPENEEIIRNSRGGGAISRQQVQDTLTELQSVGAIRKEGEPNRDGTLYRIFIPDEIETCRKFRSERAATEPKAEVSESEVDYYNVRENRIKVYERDEYKCRYCKWLTREFKQRSGVATTRS